MLFSYIFQIRHCFNKKEKTSRWGLGFTCLGRRWSKNDKNKDIVWTRISRVGEELEALREKKFKKERKKKTLITNPNHTPPFLPIYIIITITIMIRPYTTPPPQLTAITLPPHAAPHLFPPTSSSSWLSSSPSATATPLHTQSILPHHLHLQTQHPHQGNFFLLFWYLCFVFSSLLNMKYLSYYCNFIFNMSE